MNIAPVEALLRSRIGLDPSSSGPGLLARALRSRMKALALSPAQFSQYLAVLNDSNLEFEALVDEVVVPESWFFRDVQPFMLLAGTVVERWRTDLRRDPLRALSLPCARGEEPYSIAIALLDAGLGPNRFRVDAVDICRPVLESAKLGFYRENAFRTDDLGFRDRHFDATRDGYQIHERVKSTVHFSQGNILDSERLSTQPPYDVIFCRNLLIYLDDPARGLALANLDRLLGPEGVLFVGHAEQLSILAGRFQSLDERNSFAFGRRRLGSPTAPPSRPTPRPRRPARIEVVPPPASRTPSNPPPEKKNALNALDEASRLADGGKHSEAASICEHEIKMRGPSARVLYLLGVIRQAAGDMPEAFRCFEKAVYLDPRHEDALLNLSLLARRRGDLAAAAQYQRRAERAFQEKPLP